MGFRFRKRLRLFLDLSKSGASLSVGGHGLTANIGKGIQETMGLPGSGQQREAAFSSAWELLKRIIVKRPGAVV
jgi:Protein of unknown function (DUF4236)